MESDDGMKQRTLAIASVLLCVAGCAGPSAYERVFKDREHFNANTYPVDLETCWAAANRVVLALNFGIDHQEKEHGAVQASRSFKEGQRTTSILLKVNLQPDGERRTRVYVHAVQATERVFTRSHTRFFLWIIPLPGGGGIEANRVKEGEWTVEDKQFYDGFFKALDQELRAAQALPPIKADKEGGQRPRQMDRMKSAGIQHGGRETSV